MGFKLTKTELKKTALCPPGMRDLTLITVEEPYIKPANGCKVQKCEFESKDGYILPVWFNDSVMANLFEFVAAADKVTFDMDKFEDTDVELKEYIGKEVVGSISHRKTDEGKIVTQIDNFYQTGKVPF